MQGWYETHEHLFIAMEYFDLGDLRNCVTAAIKEPEAQNIIFQITEAVNFMHGKNFAHRDLKPSVCQSYKSVSRLTSC